MPRLVITELVRTNMRLVKKINKKDYVVVAWTKDEVILQSADDAKDVLIKSRRSVYGVRRKTKHH